MALDSSVAPLLPSDRPKKTRDPPREAMTGSISTNRVIALMTLAMVVVVSIYFQSQFAEYQDQLSRDESVIKKLREEIDLHEDVIERFNNSVTNTDVLQRLHGLEEQLMNESNELQAKLAETETQIAKELGDTVDQLGQTVQQAQKDIQDEVAAVKKDVESYVRTTQDQFSMENDFMVYQLAGTFTLLSCLISMWHMTAHLRRFNQPVVQRKILAICWMVPVYAITSWLSLVFHAAEGYMAIIKDFYEAYIIYQFLSFCIAVLGRGDREAVIDLLARHADHLSPPFRWNAWCDPNPWGDNHRELARAVLLQCQAFAMQFVFLRPLTTTAMFVLDQYHYYGPTGNSLDYRSPQFYLVGVQNISVFVAFTGLLKFYHAVDKDLAWCRPFAKFLCIKGVVFMTFWQGLAISILASTTDVGGNDADEWAKSAQNFLVCLEMLLFSIAHFYTFPTEEWEEGYRAKQEHGAFGDSIALGDFMSDLKLLLRSSSRSKKKKKKAKTSAKTIPDIKEEDDSVTYTDDITTRTESDLEEGIEVELDESQSSTTEEAGIIKRATLRLLESDILDEDDWQAIGQEAIAKEASKRRFVHDGGKRAGCKEYEPNLSYMGKSKRSSSPSSDEPPTETTGLLSGQRSSGRDHLKDVSNNPNERAGVTRPAESSPMASSAPEVSPNTSMSSAETEETDEAEAASQENEVNASQMVAAAKGSRSLPEGMPPNRGWSSVRAPSDEFGEDGTSTDQNEPVLRPSIFTTVADIASRGVSPVAPPPERPPTPTGEDTATSTVAPTSETPPMSEGGDTATSAPVAPPSEPPPIPEGEDTVTSAPVAPPSEPPMIPKGKDTATSAPVAPPSEPPPMPEGEDTATSASPAPPLEPPPIPGEDTATLAPPAPPSEPPPIPTGEDTATSPVVPPSEPTPIPTGEDTATSPIAPPSEPPPIPTGEDTATSPVVPPSEPPPIPTGEDTATSPVAPPSEPPSISEPEGTATSAPVAPQSEPPPIPKGEQL